MITVEPMHVTHARVHSNKETADDPLYDIFRDGVYCGWMSPHQIQIKTDSIWGQRFQASDLKQLIELWELHCEPIPGVDLGGQTLGELHSESIPGAGR
jgi:hypothetical protein